jgi:PAS domain S-box-containing protein
MVSGLLHRRERVYRGHAKPPFELRSIRIGVGGRRPASLGLFKTGDTKAGCFISEDPAEAEPPQGKSRSLDTKVMVGGCGGRYDGLIMEEKFDYIRADQVEAILHAALDCIICMDVNGRIREFNPAAEKTFGYARADVIGKELATTIIPLELREKHRLGLVRYLKTGIGPVLGKRVEIPAVRADGSRILVELAITEVRTDKGPFFTAYLRDITQRKKDADRMAVLYAVAMALSTARKIQETGTAILEQIARLGTWSIGAIWLVDNDSGMLCVVATWDDGSRDFRAFRESSKSIGFKPGEGLPGRVLSSRTIEWIPDVVLESNFPRRLAACHDGLHGACALPLFVEGGVCGVVELLSLEREEPGADLINILATLGSNIGQFLERQFAEEALKRQKSAADAGDG